MTSIAQQYVDTVNTQDAESLLALFAGDAVLRHPVGTYTGHEELGRFYRDIVFAGQAVTEIVDHWDVDGGELALLEATSRLDPNAGTVHAADVFRIDGAGRIRELEIYYR